MKLVAFDLRNKTLTFRQWWILRGGGWGVRDAPLSSISFIVMGFSTKIMPNNRLAPPGVGASSPGNHGYATTDVNKYLTFLPTRKSNLLVAMVTRNPAPMNVSGVIAMYICKSKRQSQMSENKINLFNSLDRRWKGFNYLSLHFSWKKPMHQVMSLPEFFRWGRGGGVSTYYCGQFSLKTAWKFKNGLRRGVRVPGSAKDNYKAEYCNTWMLVDF